MYQELLEALAEGRAYTLGSLSHHTGLSESLVEQLLDELEQLRRLDRLHRAGLALQINKESSNQ
jgi:DNA-binding IclR family transcriptional regulator